jgi:hypothetical protein
MLVATDTMRAATSTTFKLNINSNKPPLVIEEIGNVEVEVDLFFTF